ncbi:FCD domain-containing protein [Kocuria rhizophila]|uniref:FCD domain-containing protein n=1 Tax=Kocuria rhizophila TaxID=72000 RepID=UPI0034DB088C
MHTNHNRSPCSSGFTASLLSPRELAHPRPKRFSSSKDSRSFLDTVHRFLMVTGHCDSRAEDSHSEHEAIFAAFAARDGEKCARLLEAHIAAGAAALPLPPDEHSRRQE